MSKKIRVMIVDDSALIRKILQDGLSADPEIEVVASAVDPYHARDEMVRLKPDVVTLDIEMPKMDGVTFLKKFMKVLPTPTVIVSSLAEKGQKITLEAMSAGAVDFVTKPKIGVADQFPKMMGEVIRKVKTAAKIPPAQLRNLQRQAAAPIEEVTDLGDTTDKVIAIGSSTGGVEALARILPHFPPASPGIVITQHMPPGFTASFSQRLNNLCKIRVKEAEDGERVVTGVCYIAPGGDKHMQLIRSGGQYLVKLVSGDPVAFSRPSVDVLFSSVAKHAGKNAVAVVMTGMGKDGARGLLEIKEAGGKTFTQTESTCVVYGMPKEAVALGGSMWTVDLNDIPKQILGALPTT